MKRTLTAIGAAAMLLLAGCSGEGGFGGMVLNAARGCGLRIAGSYGAPQESERPATIRIRDDAPAAARAASTRPPIPVAAVEPIEATPEAPLVLAAHAPEPLVVVPRRRANYASVVPIPASYRTMRPVRVVKMTEIAPLPITRDLSSVAPRHRCGAPPAPAPVRILADVQACGQPVAPQCTTTGIS